MTEQSALLLRKQLAELNKNPVEGFSAGLIDDDDIYKWEVVIIGPQDTLFEGGFFKAYLTFPYDYPLRPPKMKFISEIWHPNVSKNGEVCISILHEPGEDKFGYEKPEELIRPRMWMLRKSGGTIQMVNSRGRWLVVYGKAKRFEFILKAYRNGIGKKIVSSAKGFCTPSFAKLRDMVDQSLFAPVL
ncbi:hypothetical protein DPEC_G00262260 [Dallia pectoralis]|uniref:Uncharacterized protein n=1 Tax=Dallia pectoralis TaxID=75939 RepID=A0ACC2FRR4_DALPE|nr:hypothetical protein DPEC_G00262260 [Dallia pectoralis]